MSYRTVDGLAESIGSALKSGLDYYGQTQADKSAAELARAQAAAGGAAAAPSDSGFPIMPVVLLGAAGLAAWMLFKKKKA